MYEFHYIHIKIKYKNYAKLSFTDADSLVYEIEMNDIYKGFYEDKIFFDFSDYLKDLKFFDLVKKLCWENEFKGKIISELVGCIKVKGVLFN